SAAKPIRSVAKMMGFAALCPSYEQTGPNLRRGAGSARRVLRLLAALALRMRIYFDAIKTAPHPEQRRGLPSRVSKDAAWLCSRMQLVRLTATRRRRDDNAA